MLDSFDKSILSALQRDGRASLVDVGSQVGLSASACHKRIRSLEQAGFISGYVAVVSEEKVGLATSVFVQVTLKSQKEDMLAAFEASLQRHEEVMECFLMAGLSDYIVRILCRDAADYERIHNTILTRLPGVDRVVSNFAIRKVLRRNAVPVA